MTQDGNCEVVVADRFNAREIQDLADKKILAIRIPSFCESIVCDHVMQKLGRVEGEGYRVEPQFRKIIGGALFDGADDPAALEQYFKNVPVWYGETRTIFHPHTSPAEHARLYLQEVWPYGSVVQRIGGRLTFVGLIRGFREGGEARPHQDMTNWDLPSLEDAQTLKTQISCLTYFACAEEGGELELWGREIEDRKEYAETQDPGDYGLRRDLIGEPDAMLRPQIGELIMFNARRIHGVREVKRGVRFSQSFFIGYRGSDYPLSLFS